jgi:Alkylated DNA repair protein
MEKSLKSYFSLKKPESQLEKEPKLGELVKTPIPQVPGLTLIENFLSEAEERQLFQEINKMPWLSDLKRRTQHYGYKYDYNSRDTAGYLGELPKFMDFIIERMISQRVIEMRPDQCIVNEYEPGQGISPHIDIIKAFGNEIVSISLNSDIIMDFYNADNNKVSVLLPRRSLVLLKDEARYKWKHGIAERKKDKLDNGLILYRRKRISLTFRTVINK